MSVNPDEVSEPEPWAHSDVAPVYATFAAAMDGFGGFERAPLLLVAVSGGADSLALCLMAHKWASARGGRAHGVTIDHGLRPEAAQEAQQVAAWLAAYNISHSVRVWQGAKPASGVQAAAREARYALLDAEARDLGALHLLLGHQADDQRETVIMRGARGKGSGIGAAGMAAMTYRRDLRVLRPLLQISKAQLEKVCAVLTRDWVRDPSNQSPVYERVRVRGHLAHMPPVERDALDRGIADSQRHRQTLEQGIARAVARHVRLSPLGWGWIDRDLWGRDVEAQVRRIALVRVVQAVGGRVYPPSRVAMNRVETVLLQGSEQTSIGGCILRSARGGVWVVREQRDDVVSVDAAGRWDGRYAGDAQNLTYPEGHEAVRILHSWLESRAWGENSPNRTIIRRIPVQNAADNASLRPALGYDGEDDGQNGVKIRFSPAQSLTYCLGWLAPSETDIIS